MRNREISLQSFIVPTLPFSTLLVVISFGLWLVSYLTSDPFNSTNSLGGYWEILLRPNTLLSSVVSFGFTVLNAILLSQINTKFNLIRTRTFLPFFVFILLMGTWSDTHVMNGSNFSLTLFALSLFLFFDIYRNPVAVEQAFLGSFLIGLSSIMVSPYLFFIPVVWIGLGMFQSLSLRNFLASLFGVINPWIFYLLGLYYFDSNFDFMAFMQSQFVADFSMPVMNELYQIYSGVFALIVVIAIVGLFVNSNYDAIHTRRKNNLLLIFLLTLLVLSFVFSSRVLIFVPFIAFLSALLVSHTFSLNKGLVFPLLFYLLCVGSIVFFLINQVFAGWLILLT